jgi:hypothetical protein
MLLDYWASPMLGKLSAKLTEEVRGNGHVIIHLCWLNIYYGTVVAPKVVFRQK